MPAIADHAEGRVTLEFKMVTIARATDPRGGDDGVSPDLVVVVLAGGEGRRMGGGKPLRRVGGRTLISLALDKARGWSPRVAVAVRSPDQVGAVEAPLVLDEEGVAGPLAGLVAALSFATRASASRLLTLPCDMPGLPDDLAARLGEALLPGGGAAVATCAGRLHPLCAIWDVGARADVPAYIATGRSSVWGFAERVGMTRVDWHARYAPAFDNLNTPAELADTVRVGRR